MPFIPHRRVTFSGCFGPLASPYEFWSFRLNDVGIAGASDNLATIAGACAAIFQQDTAQLGGLRTVIRTYARLTQVKVADIGADGKYVRESGFVEVDIAGSSTAGSVFPPQVATAVSLETARLGASGRGRFYLPAPAVDVVDTTGRMSVGAAQLIADTAGRFVNDIGNVVGMGQIAVVSTKGFSSAVTGVRVGRALDTIRSRRTSLVEDYGTSVATPQ